MKNIVITISDSYINDLKPIARQLRREGLKIANVYEFGVITGSADEEIIPALRGLKEILSLTEEKQVDISPPESDLQ